MATKDHIETAIRLIQLVIVGLLSVFVASLIYELILSAAGNQAESYAIVGEIASFLVFFLVFYRITSRILQT